MTPPSRCMTCPSRQRHALPQGCVDLCGGEADRGGVEKRTSSTTFTAAIDSIALLLRRPWRAVSGAGIEGAVDASCTAHHLLGDAPHDLVDRRVVVGRQSFARVKSRPSMPNTTTRAEAVPARGRADGLRDAERMRGLPREHGRERLVVRLEPPDGPRRGPGRVASITTTASGAVPTHRAA